MYSFWRVAEETMETGKNREKWSEGIREFRPEGIANSGHCPKYAPFITL